MIGLVVMASVCGSAFDNMAKNVKPGATAAEVQKAIVDRDWLKTAQEEPVEVLGGWIPVGLNDKDSTFVVRCKEKGYAMYGRISGRSHRTLSQLLGAPSSSSKGITLIEFAYVLPDGKIEVYGPNGHTSLHL